MRDQALRISLLAAAVAFAGCARGQASAPPEDAAAAQHGIRVAGDRATAVPTVTELERAFETAAQTIAPSVVSITSARPADDELPPFLRPFAPPDGQVHGMGSGVIIDAKGHVLTNNHVVDGADSLIVRLDDGRELEPTIVGTDPKTDLAVLRIDAPGLVPAQLGDSGVVRVGQWVIAAGSPFGLPRTVTAGIVSAVGRGSMGITDYGDFIQTDAAVNQGNSGGPLIDLRGRVIGINTAIASRTGGSIGIGFAIPVDLARTVMRQLIEQGRVDRGWLGIAMGELTPDLARSFGFGQGDGVLVNDVIPGGPAAAAGLRPGDIVHRLEGREVRDMSAFRTAIAQTPPGHRVRLTVWRSGEAHDISIELGRLPPELGGAERPPPGKPGVDPKKPSAQGPAKLGLKLDDPDAPEGAVIVGVAPRSVAASAEVRPGDVILSVQGKRIRSAKHAQRLLSDSDLDRGVRIRVQRGERAYFVVLRRS